MDQGAAADASPLSGHPGIVLRVRGNCGVIHESFDAWVNCHLCKLPPQPITWRDWITNFQCEVD